MTFLVACDENNYSNPDLIFKDSYPIYVSSYNYIECGHNYNITGDTASILNITDTLNTIPLLAWDSIFIPIITVAIFNSRIEVSGNDIQNINNIVWQWHTGMTPSAYLNGMQHVKYTDGRNMQHNEIDYASPVDSLSEGLYYWAVWGWSASGINIIYSSRELNFYVKK